MHQTSSQQTGNTICWKSWAAHLGTRLVGNRPHARWPAQQQLRWACHSRRCHPPCLTSPAPCACAPSPRRAAPLQVHRSRAAGHHCLQAQPMHVHHLSGKQSSELSRSAWAGRRSASPQQQYTHLCAWPAATCVAQQQSAADDWQHQGQAAARAAAGVGPPAPHTSAPSHWCTSCSSSALPAGPAAA